MTDNPSRRDIIRNAGIAGVAATLVPVGALSDRVAAAQPPAPPAPQSPAESANAKPGRSSRRFFFNDEEARFIEACIDRLIPPDDKWAGAKDAGVLEYIDRQLAGAYGAGARMYLRGPWQSDAPTQQGYQLRHAPGALYRVAIDEIRDAVRKDHNGQEFAELADTAKDEVLSSLEAGRMELTSVPGPVFFETLLANTIEGFFADPAYGGNRGMVGWRMVGFPGAYAQYVEVVDVHNLDFRRPPIGIGDDGLGMHDVPEHRS